MEHELLHHLYKQYMKKIYIYLRKIGCSRLDAEDIVQDTFIKAIDYADSISPAKIQAWLFRVAINRYYDLCRNNKKTTYVSINDDHVFTLLLSQADTEEIVLTLERKQQMQLIINQLKPDFQHVLLLKYVMEMSIKEMAEITDKKENTIKVQLLRARKAFKHYWEEQSYE
jgi:RNA polymerase sigma factor (sigma-70 family)